MTNRRAPDTETSLIGHYAGAVTRLAALALDITLTIIVFNLAVAAGDWLAQRFFGISVDPTDGSPVWIVALLAWQFVYFAYCWTLSGKTPAMALLGLRVVRGDGSDLDRNRAALRALTLPLGAVCFGLGYVGVVLGRRRRALHDVIADTGVIYDFDARAARLRFLMRKPVRPSDPS
ncbi:MAG: RDD family protein [Actinomycetota bacterium]